jgi:hypothetical protein
VNRISTNPCPRVGKQLAEVWVAEGIVGFIVRGQGCDLVAPTEKSVDTPETRAFLEFFEDHKRTVDRR